MPVSRKRGRIGATRWAKRKSRWADRRVQNKISANVRRAVNQVISRRAETKFNEVNTGWLDVLHNNANGFYRLCRLEQGLTENTRVGNEVMAVGLCCKVGIISKPQEPNCTWRIMAFNVPFGVTTIPSDLFDNSPTTVSFMMNFVNTDRYKVLYNKVIHARPFDASREEGAENRETTYFRKIWIPLRGKKLTYTRTSQDPTQQYGNIFVAVFGYSEEGTDSSTVVGRTCCVSRFYFKDM